MYLLIRHKSYLQLVIGCFVESLLFPVSRICVFLMRGRFLFFPSAFYEIDFSTFAFTSVSHDEASSLHISDGIYADSTRFTLSFFFDFYFLVRRFSSFQKDRRLSQRRLMERI